MHLPKGKFQKILTYSPQSASALEDPAEKRRFAYKTANAPTYCWKTARVGQKLPFWPLYVGASAVFGGNLRFSAGNTKSDAELGLYMRIFWNSSVGPRTVAVNTGVRRADCQNIGHGNVKRGDIFGFPPKIMT